ncbi:MAG TPA: Gfo/Idh/MocA family oxidoreductase [Chryseolinea sp.]|nr:Gfo/Idh/MocA family oxidoreductase [Chryseolinea sp.]
MRFIEGPVKWGIIGCGDVCEVKSGPAFSKIHGSSLVAVMRRDAAKAEDFAKRHRVPVFYSDATELIQDKDVTAVYIATPPESHETYAIEAMEAGKPVYIEKPVTITSSSCQRIAAASRRLLIPATVAHYRRALDLFQRVKKLITEGEIGDVKLVTLNLFQPPKKTGPAENWRVNPSLSGGGPFFDLAPHQLDILYWLFGKPKSLYGSSVNQGKYYDAADVTTLNAVFDNDIVFQGTWSFNIPAELKRDSCRIIGEKGSLEFPFFSSFTKATLDVQGLNNYRQEDFIFPEHIQQPMITSVINYFLGKGPNPCSLEEAETTMMMMEKANQPAG